MQTVSSAMMTALSAHESGGQSFDLQELVEIYTYDYTPGINGFDPSQAEKRFCGVLGFTFLGLAYERQYIDRGDVQRFFGTQENTVTLNFSNTDRSFAQWIQSHDVAGKWLVLRVISTGSSAVLADSLVIFCGRLDKPGDFDDTTATLTATQRFGQLNQQFPPRTFSPNDPKGRDPADPLFEGFRFTAIQSLVQWVTRDPRMSGFGLLLGLKKHTTHSLQASSSANFQSTQAVPDAFGRVQLPHVYLATIDIGGDINVALAFCEGGEDGIDTFENVRQINPKFGQLQGLVHRYGCAGGQASSIYPEDPQIPVKQQIPGSQIPGDGYYSFLAWLSGYVQGSTPDTDEAQAPSFLAVIKAKRIKTPDGTGAWMIVAWSDNPVDIARHLISHPRYFNEGDAACEDAVNYDSWKYCNKYILDRTNAERSFIPQADASQQGATFQRYTSTGVVTSTRIRQEIIGDLAGDPALTPIPVEPFDPVNPPTSIALKPVLRKRFTCNATCTERQTAVDYLNNIINPSGRLYQVRNGKGRVENRVEKPADNTRLRSAVSAGDMTVKVLDVEPWKSGLLLLTQRLLIGAELTSSEVRNVTAANYTSDGNAITLVVAVTGGVTATRSGATFAGGNSSTAATATITIGGTPAEGDTVTVTINGISFTFTVDADPTTASVAAMLTYWIQAVPALRQFVKATWDGSSSVVNLAARYGVLTLDSALANSHTAQTASPSSASTLTASSGGALPAGTLYVAYAYRNALGNTVISPLQSIVVTLNQKIVTTSLGALPAGVLSVDWYVSKYVNTDELVFFGNNDGSALTITDCPESSNDLAPDINTTGEELLRVAMSFAANDQGATVLAQTGLTRGNVHAGTAKWPLGDKQSTINQLKGSFYNSVDDFALTPLEVNDFDHQATTRKVDSQDVDLSAFDNLNQASRYLQFMIAKLRDGDFFVQKDTNPLAMLLEEGDVICESFDNGGFVNLPVRIEELSIGKPPTFSVSTTSRLYSTSMFSDNVRRHSVSLPTTLRAVTPLDTLWEFIDLGPVRDADSGTPRVYVVAGFGSSAQGSWKGWQLWADFGSGYTKIFESDIPGTLGTASGTLTAGTINTYYPSATITGVTLSLGSLDITHLSQADMDADPRAHLVAYGNEYLQYSYATQNPTTGVWTATGLYRGRLGTDAPSHSAGERFVSMDTVELITLPVEILGLAKNYKAVTVNENVADVSSASKTWTGGTLKYPPPGIQATRDTTTGNWRYDLFGQETTDPTTERFKLEIVGGSTYVVRPAQGRPVSLTTSSALGSDYVSPKPSAGKYRAANVAGNSVANSAAYVAQLIDRERLVFSATWATTLNSSSAPASNSHTLDFSPGGIYGLTLTIKAKTSTDAGYLNITDSTGNLFTDSTGEATGTRYSVEFVDGKVRFYRNRSKNGSPFFTANLPPTVLPGGSGAIFPCEIHVTAGTLTSWSDMEIQDERASLLYPAAQQVADFGTAQSSVTVRACQQRVVGGQVVDGQITQVTFP